MDFTAAPPLGTVHPEDTGRYGPGAPWAREWRATRDRWTRKAHATRDWDTALDAQVMLMSRELRAAYVRMVAGLRGYSGEKRQELVAEQQADGDRFVEVWVAMQTSRWEWNDLTSNRTLWTVTFVDDAGRTAETVERAQIAVKHPELDELFADVTPFTIAWRLRFPTHFPDGTPLLSPESRRVTVRFAGPLGTSAVSWVANR